MSEFHNIKSVETEDALKIKTDESLFSENFYFSDIYDESLYKKFIKNIERLVRTSREYRAYIAALRSTYSVLNHDNILINITDNDAELEFHHYPLSLYDLIDVMVMHKIVNKKKITTFSIAEELMNLHFNNIIGLVPLSKTTHELAHNGAIFISTKQVFGDYKEFINKYSDGVSVELKDKIEKLEKESTDTVRSDVNGIF